MTYEQYRSYILDNYPVLGTGPVVDLLAGSAAGGTAVMCTYPLDLARTKLAYQVYITYLITTTPQAFSQCLCLCKCMLRLFIW